MYKNSYYPRAFFAVLVCLFAFSFIAVSVVDVQAIPAFARKYRTSCSTCHYAFPKLNAFGKAFHNNGYRYPGGQDAQMVKEKPVSLGSEAYKRVWPDAIWPTNIAGTAPFSVQAVGRFHYFKSEKQTSFEVPHEFELFYAGTFDDKISYFGELELEHESEMGYTFDVQYDFSPAFHLKMGSVGLEHATPEGLRLTTAHYNVMNLKNQSGTWRMRSGGNGGLELWGATKGIGNKGGLTYAVGIANGQHDEENYDLNKSKDVYGRVTYKIGGLSEVGGTEGQASSTSEFYIDNSFRLGGFFYSGKASKGSAEDKFSVVGTDIDWWFNRLNVVATLLTMNSTYMGSERKSLAYFIEGNYVLYPWLIAYARYEYTDVNKDDTVEARTSLIPALIIMLRANVKCSLEYNLPLDTASKGGGGFTYQFNFAF